MKSKKILLSAIATTSLMGFSAFAAELEPVLISTKGQCFVLYRSSEPTIALQTGGTGIGMTTNQTPRGELRPVFIDNGHGQQTMLYREMW